MYAKNKLRCEQEWGNYFSCEKNRLYAMTKSSCKPHLPVYYILVIYGPLETLLKADIKDISLQVVQHSKQLQPTVGGELEIIYLM